MKGKNLSKVLAFLLAAVMIFSALPLMAFASDEAETYTVSYGAPAIPMNEMTIVNLADISVEMEKGTVVSGADITWAADAQTGIEFDANAKTVFAKVAGRYKLTATANDVTKDVWVLVKKVDETDFYLVNLPTLNKNTVNVDDWKLFNVKTGAVPTDGIYTASSDFIRSPNTCLMVYVDEIFEDFADYTVEANMASNADATETKNAYRGAGLAGRVALVDGAWNFNGVVTYIRQDYCVGVRKLQAASSYTFFGEGRDVYQYDEEGNIPLGGTNGTTKLTDPEKKAWKNNSTYHIVKNVYSGTELEVFYDGESLGNSASYDDTKYTCRSQTAAGYPGVVGYDGRAYLKSFAVKLNSNDMPNAIPAEEKPAEPEAKIDITGSGDATVEAVVGSENTYTVALAPAVGYKVKTLSLIVNGDIRVNFNHDNTGLVYTFTADDLANTVISVEYIPDDGTFNTVMAGASVLEERSAIRFGARTDLIKRSTTNAAVGTLDNRIKVGDTVYEITEIGMLLIPKGLFEGELTVDTKNVARQQVTKVVTLTDTFSDIAINLVGIPTSYYDVEICSRMYVAYEENGETKYVYTDVIVRTYNQVLEAIGK